MAEGRLLFCVIYIRYQDRNDNTKYHQNDGEHFEITHKFALLSKISLCRDFYVIRGFSPSVEGLTAYRSLAVPDCILPERMFDIKQNICYSLITTMNVAVSFLVSFLLCAHEFLSAPWHRFSAPFSSSSTGISYILP